MTVVFSRLSWFVCCTVPRYQANFFVRTERTKSRENPAPKTRVVTFTIELVSLWLQERFNAQGRRVLTKPAFIWFGWRLLGESNGLAELFTQHQQSPRKTSNLNSKYWRQLSIGSSVVNTSIGLILQANSLTRVIYSLSTEQTRLSSAYLLTRLWKERHWHRPTGKIQSV